MNIIIKKFGGTSVSSIDRIERAISYIKNTRKSGYHVVVVVSALGKETFKYSWRGCGKGPR